MNLHRICLAAIMVGLLTAGNVHAAGAGAAKVSSASSAKIAWRTSYRKAFDEATSQGKPILVQITASWCGYCHQMQNHTYTNPALMARVNRGYIPLMLDADKQPDLVRAFRASSLPTTLIVSTDLKILARSSGYQSATTLGTQLAKWEPTTVPADEQLVATTEPAEASSSMDTEMQDMTAAALEPAFNSYCLVSMLEDGKLVEGSTEFSLVRDGSLVCFASAEHRDRFAASPEKFWPVSGGSCPVSIQEEDSAAAGNPEFAVVFRGRLWFFTDSEHQERFLSNPAEYAMSQL